MATTYISDTKNRKEEVGDLTFVGFFFVAAIITFILDTTFEFLGTFFSTISKYKDETLVTSFFATIAFLRLYWEIVQSSKKTYKDKVREEDPPYKIIGSDKRVKISKETIKVDREKEIDTSGLKEVRKTSTRVSVIKEKGGEIIEAPNKRFAERVKYIIENTLLSSKTSVASKVSSDNEVVGDRKIDEPEALSCEHNFDGNKVCLKCGWSKKKLKKIKEDSASEEQWYWSKKGSDERNGPVGRERLEEMAEGGNLEREDLVWHEGFDDWKEAGSVEGVSKNLKKFLLGRIVFAVRKSKERSASENQWYWSKKGSDERNGPVGRERLEGLAEEGNLKPGDLVWREGFDDWEEAGSVEELEEGFASPPPLPDESSYKKDEEPPTLPQSGPDDNGKAPKSEAISCVHDYDENNICQKCGWSETELKEIDGSKSDDTEKSEVSEKFGVEWGGWVLTSDSTLTLRKDEVSLVDMADEEVSLSYDRVEVKETDGREVVLRAPMNFERDIEHKKDYNLNFSTKRYVEKASRLLKKSKASRLLEKTPTSVLEDEQIESPKEYEFLAEFEVEWGGFVTSVESTLQLLRDEMSLQMNNWSNAYFKINYSYIEVKEIDGNTVILEAPTGLDEKSWNKKHYLNFDSEEKAEKFLDSIKKLK